MSGKKFLNLSDDEFDDKNEIHVHSWQVGMNEAPNQLEVETNIDDNYYTSTESQDVYNHKEGFLVKTVYFFKSMIGIPFRIIIWWVGDPDPEE